MDRLLDREMGDQIILKIGDFEYRGYGGHGGPEHIADPASYGAYIIRNLHNDNWQVVIDGEYNEVKDGERWKAVSECPKFLGGNSHERIGDLDNWHSRNIDSSYYRHGRENRNEEIVWQNGLGPLFKQFTELTKNYKYFGYEFKDWDQRELARMQGIRRQNFDMTSLFLLHTFLRNHRIRFIHPNPEDSYKARVVATSTDLLNNSPRRIMAAIINRRVNPNVWRSPSLFSTNDFEHIIALIKNDRSLRSYKNARAAVGVPHENRIRSQEFHRSLLALRLVRHHPYFVEDGTDRPTVILPQNFPQN